MLSYLKKQLQYDSYKNNETRDSEVPINLKITTSIKTGTIPYTIYLGRNSWWNEYILLYFWADDDKCLWQVWCPHISFIGISFIPFGTWDIHVLEKAGARWIIRRNHCGVSNFWVSNALWSYSWHAKVRMVTAFSYGKNDSMLGEVWDITDYRNTVLHSCS